MNKSELIEAMAIDSGITKAAAKAAMHSFLGNIRSTLAKGDKIAIVGFGVWSVSTRSAREGRNPSTGKIIQIAAKNVVKFKASGEMSTNVNQ